MRQPGAIGQYSRIFVGRYPAALAAADRPWLARHGLEELGLRDDGEPQRDRQARRATAKRGRDDAAPAARTTKRLHGDDGGAPGPGAGAPPPGPPPPMAFDFGLFGAVDEPS